MTTDDQQQGPGADRLAYLAARHAGRRAGDDDITTEDAPDEIVEDEPATEDTVGVDTELGDETVADANASEETLAVETFEDRVASGSPAATLATAATSTGEASRVGPDPGRGPFRSRGSAQAAGISVRGLTKTFGDAPAVGPLDLEIAPGQRISLVGHNGSGKTTLMKMIAGLLDPTDGTATVGGHEAGSMEARRALSYLGDQPVFYDDLTVTEHLEYIARLHDTEDWADLAAPLLETLGIAHRADDVPITFSRGLKQKAAIALAFIRPFDVMVIDEPFVGLDQQGRRALIGLIDEASDRGATMVVATHETSSVQAAHRLIALRDGDVIHDGPAAGAELSDLLTR